MSGYDIALILLIASAPFLVLRLIRGPEWTDRLIATDMLGLTLAASILLLRHESGWGWDRDAVWILVLAALIGNLGAVILIEHFKNSRNGDDSHG